MAPVVVDPTAAYATHGGSGPGRDGIASPCARKYPPLSDVFGQGRAVPMFAAGLHSTTLTAAADAQRKRPQSGVRVGQAAGSGQGPFRGNVRRAPEAVLPAARHDPPRRPRGVQSVGGFAPSYRGAWPGLLAGFVQKAPEAILLFDEIERPELAGIIRTTGASRRPAPASTRMRSPSAWPATDGGGVFPASLETRVPQRGHRHLHAPQCRHRVIVPSFAAAGFQ